MALMQFKSEIIEIINDSPSVKTFVLSTPSGFEFKPGQFVMIAATLIIDTRQEIVKRAYSISSRPSLKGKIWISVKKVKGGKASTYLHGIKRGDFLEVTGPLGHFFIKDESMHRNIVLVGAGIGVAPFRSIIPDLIDKGFKKDITLLRGSRFINDHLFDNEFAQLMKKFPSLKIYSSVTMPEHFNHSYDMGRVQVLLDKYVPACYECDYYICGPHQMIKDVTESLNQKGIPHKHIHFERYD
jgi:ferredoxin-NADP reductase